jgi:hypothetical protein
MNGALKENRRLQRRDLKTSDSTMSKASLNGKVSSRNLGTNQRQGHRHQQLPQSFTSLAGNGDRAVRALSSEPLTDQELQGQWRSKRSVKNIYKYQRERRQWINVYISLENGVWAQDQGIARLLWEYALRFLLAS